MLRIADLSHRLWKPPEILVCTSLRETIKKKNTRIYTGLPAIGVFLALTKYLKKRAIRLRQWRGEMETGEKYSPRGQKPWKTFPVEEQFFAVLAHARMRLGLKAEDVCDRTGLAPSTFSKMFATLGGFFFALKLPLLFPWPSRKVIDVTTPPCFAKYPSTRVIIDCIEMQVQRPTSLLHQSVIYSQYKSRHTFKVLVGISPCGLVTFLSSLWGGRVSDREITPQSRLVKDDKMLEEEDSVMADRGFGVEDILAHKNVRLNAPPSPEWQTSPPGGRCREDTKNSRSTNSCRA